jgi:hypothetical protein
MTIVLDRNPLFFCIPFYKKKQFVNKPTTMLSLLSGYFQVPQPAKTIQNTKFSLSFGQICESNHNHTLSANHEYIFVYVLHYHSSMANSTF